MSDLAELRAELCRQSGAGQAIVPDNRSAMKARFNIAIATLKARLGELLPRGSTSNETASTSALPDGDLIDLPAWTRRQIPSPAAYVRQVWRDRFRPALGMVMALSRRAAVALAGGAVMLFTLAGLVGRAAHRRKAGVKRLGLSVCGAALLYGAGTAVVLNDSPPGSPAVALVGSANAAVADSAASVADEWLPSERPIEVFSISAPSFIDGQLTYLAERNRVGPTRRDTLTLGTFGGEGPWLGLALHRQLSADGHELAATAARLSMGSATAPTDSTMVQTKFGPVIAAGLKAGLPGHLRSCIAFGRYEEGLRFAIQGLYCAGDGRAADPRTLTCLVDRIELVGSASDPQLRTLFVATEKRRDFCGAGDPRATGAKRAWFQGGPPAATHMPARRQP